MKTLLFLITLVTTTPLLATTFSHRTMAENLVNKISVSEVLQSSVKQALNPFLRQLSRDGMPEELSEIGKFTETAAGNKFLLTLPELTKQRNKQREDYAKSKQPQLMERIQPIVARYETKLAAETAKMQ